MCESESPRMETTETALKLDGVVEVRGSLSFQETILVRDVMSRGDVADPYFIDVALYIFFANTQARWQRLVRTNSDRRPI
jgi:hypothetical protein